MNIPNVPGANKLPVVKAMPSWLVWVAVILIGWALYKKFA